MKRTAFLGSIAAAALLAPVAAFATQDPNAPILGQALEPDSVVHQVYRIDIDTSQNLKYEFSALVNAQTTTRLAVRFEDDNQNSTLWEFSPKAYEPGVDSGDVRLSMMITAPSWAKAVAIGVSMQRRDAKATASLLSLTTGHAIETPAK
jgi:hypothetical protein